MSVTGAQIVAEVRRFLGDAYVYGADGPSTFDCSGLAQHVYSQLGISIPRTSEEQFTAGTPVPAADAQPGDLVFFGGNGYDGTPSSPGHVGIYIGGGQMIDAPYTGTVVRIDPIDGNVGFRSYGTADATTTGATDSFSLGGLLGFPSQIVQVFEDIDGWFGDFYKHVSFFFQPSSYVRIGAGIAGTALLVTGMLLLAKEARSA